MDFFHRWMDKTILYWLNNKEKVFHEDELVPIQLFFKDDIVHELHTIENIVEKPWKSLFLWQKQLLDSVDNTSKPMIMWLILFTLIHSQYMHKNKSFIAIYLLEYTERSMNSSIFFFWRNSKQFFGVYDAHFTKQHLP